MLIQKPYNKLILLEILIEQLVQQLQVAKLCKPFTNNYSANTILSKIQLHKIGQSGGFLGRLLGSFIKTGFPFIVNVAKIG